MLSRLTLFLLTALLTLGGISFAQTPDPVKWSATLEPASPRVGEAGRIVVTAKIDKGWHIYAPTAKGGPIAAKIELVSTPALSGLKLVQPVPETKYDEGFRTNVDIYKQAPKFALPFKVTAAKAGDYKANLSIRFQTCNERLCLPPKTLTVPLNIEVEAGAARDEFLTPDTKLPEQAAQASGTQTAPEALTDDAPIQRGNATNGGILPFMGAAFLAGLVAILTPCVFPMIPITVSLFSKRGGGLAGPIVYCAGIIGTFTLIGIVVSALFGASSLSLFAANPIVNLAFATLFIVLALNLFGVFEIIVPASILQRVQPQYTPNGGKQSLLAPLLMGFAFTLTSFTCTVPFVGTTLVSAATQGPLYPALGMLSFATAFALPFFLLALFPSALAKLPRSGEWLVSVKAFMGFLELAAALKFLQTADYYWGLGLLTRPVFLAIWFAIAVVAGFYLLRWLRLPKDSPNTKIGPFRYTLGAATLGVAVWLLAANNGVSLRDFDAYLPPKNYGSKEAAASHWLKNDLQGAIAKAKEQNKPLLINFTGYACTNCRLMENNVLPHSDVTNELGAFVPVELFTDGSDATSRGFNAYQQKKFGTVAIPMFAVVTPDGEIKGRLDGLERDPAKFAEFLRDSKAKMLTAQR